MRTIRKHREPPSLTQHRCTPHADYDNYGDKDILRGALVAEQRGLCCYCMSRIHPDSDSMKIAHWHSQDRHPSEQLDYGNLLGACPGNQGQPRRSQHCDTRQGNDDISRNPADPAHRVEAAIKYLSDGTIVSDDPEFNRNLSEVLNLNVAFLKRNRQGTLDGFKAWLARTRPGDWTRATIEKHLREWNGECQPGDLKPFCQVVVYYLRKRLARM